MNKKIVHFILLILSFVCLPNLVTADYFPWMTITELDATYRSLTLEDGSTWKIDPLNLPNVSNSWFQGGAVWIMPIYQAGSPQPNVSATLFFTGWTAAMATLDTGSTKLSITTVNPTAGTVTLSDGTSWNLDPHYQKYYTTWQIDDPITLSGHKYQYYLINGTSRYSGQTFSLAIPS